jgi:hypothetical protein
MPLTETEKKTANKAASDALKKCKTVDELREAWRNHYLILGHKALGRLFLGTVTETGERLAPATKG